jgi:hypothetical protein
MAAPLGFHCGLDDQITAVGARDGPLDQQQISLGVNAHDFNVLGGHTGVTHLARHLLAFEYTSGRLALTYGARRPVRKGVTVSLILGGEVPALHGAGEPFTLGAPCHVDGLAILKQGNAKLFARLVLFPIFTFKTEFPEITTCLNAIFSKMARFRPGNAGCSTGDQWLPEQRDSHHAQEF